MLLTGCSLSVPSCSDPDTIDFVIELAKKQNATQLWGFGKKQGSEFGYQITAIPTTHNYEQTGAHQRAADLE